MDTLRYVLVLPLALALSVHHSTAFAQDDDPGAVEVTVASEPIEEAPPADDRRALGEALWISGLSVWAVTYVFTGLTATTLVTVANTRPATIAESWIPVVGPWIMLGDSVGFDTGQIAGTIISGVLQAAGVAMFIAGVVLVDEAPRGGNTRVELGPLFTDGGGLRLAGAF
jgi:hypothetical protein